MTALRHIFQRIRRMGPNAQGAVAALLLLLIVAGVFARVCRNEFLWWDDPKTIHHNDAFNPPSAESIGQYWSKPAAGLYVPLTYTAWGALAYVAEAPETDATGIHLRPEVYHAASLVLHLACALVVFSILRLVSGAVWAAFGGALLFSLHPLQVEAVAWASGMKDLLSGLLALVAVYQYLRFAMLSRQSSPGAGQRAIITCYVSGAAMMLLAMLAKPSAMVVPLLALVLDLLVIRRPWRKALVAAGIWGLLAIPLMIVARQVQASQGVAPVEWWQRPLVAADAAIFYLYKLVWPLDLAPDYARKPSYVLDVWGGWWSMVTIAIVVALGVLLWRKRRSLPWIVAGALLFIGGALPVLGFASFMFQYTSTVADHYLYVAMLGPAIVATWGLVRYRGIAGGGTAVAGLATAAFLSFTQLGLWRDDSSLWAHTMEVSPRSFIAPNNLAASLGRWSRELQDLAEEAMQRGDRREHDRLMAQRREALTDAVALLDRSLDIFPDYTAALHNAFVNHMRLGNAAQAVARLERMIAANEIAPPHMRENYSGYHDAAGKLWARLGKHDRAAEHFEALLRKMPNHPTAAADLTEQRRRIAQASVDPR